MSCRFSQGSGLLASLLVLVASGLAPASSALGSQMRTGSSSCRDQVLVHIAVSVTIIGVLV